MSVLPLMRSVPLRARWILPVAWMIVIFMASADASSGTHSSAIVEWLVAHLGLHLTPGQDELANHLFRKASHFTEYAVLSLCWAWALPPGRHRLRAAWLIATLYAGTDEFHQRFVPSRGPSLGDVAIDSSGALVAMIARSMGDRRTI